MLLPMLLFGGAAFLAYDQSVKAGNRVTDEALNEVLPIAHLRADLYQAQNPLLASIFGGRPIGPYRAVEARIEAGFATLLAGDGLTEERRDLTSSLREWTASRRIANEILTSPLMNMPDGRGREAAADAAIVPYVAAVDRAIAATRLASEQGARDLGSETGSAGSRQQAIGLSLLLVGLLTIAAAALVGRRLARSVIEPIVQLQDASRELGQGDFSQRVDLDRRDEIGALGDVFNMMASDLARHHDDLRKAQDGLIQAQKMEAVGQLAGGIAHDFNNLLLVVGTYADFLRESLDEDDPRRDDAAEIRKASDRASQLTRQLLTVSRRDVAQPIPLDAAATVAGMEELLRRTVPATIQLRLELPEHLPATLVDAGRLEQAVLNLVLNARNAMPDGGSLTIRARALELDADQVGGLRAGRYVSVSIADTGHGMSSEVRRRALEPFFTTRAESGGTGLGLSTAYGIATNAGGTIAIESTPGHGTTATVYLPVTEAAVEPAAADEPGPVDSRRDDPVVLVAEDEPTIRELTSRILTRSGYTVLVAASGPDALELARATERIDILLTDAIMPGMTGGELAETLQRERPGLPVVFMSGYSDDIVAEHGVIDPGTRYLAKPFTPNELLALLADALAGSGVVAV